MIDIVILFCLEEDDDERGGVLAFALMGVG